MSTASRSKRGHGGLLQATTADLLEASKCRFDRSFFERSTEAVAPDLIGALLCRRVDDRLMIGLVNECEAYIGEHDRGCHTFGGRRTDRTKVMYEEAGHAYIYLIYGMYNCLNVVTEPDGTSGAVLFRSLVPLYGQDDLSTARYSKAYASLSRPQKRHLADGPGKLCQAMKIDRALNGHDLLGEELWLSPSPFSRELFHGTERTPRIGIDYAGEAKDWLLRYHLPLTAEVLLR